LSAQEPPIRGEVRIGVELGAPEYRFGLVTTLTFVGADRIAVAQGLSKRF